MFSDSGSLVFWRCLSDFLSRACEGKEFTSTGTNPSSRLEAWDFMVLCETSGNQRIEGLTPGTQVSLFLLLSIQCSRNCSGGFQIREIQCVDSRDHRSLRPFHCQFLAGIPPPLSMSCNTEPCEEWQVEPWSQVWPLDTPSTQPGKRESLCYHVSLEVREGHMCIMPMTGLHSVA